MKHNPIICAIDTHNLEHAEKLTDSLRDSVSVFKLGLEFFTSQGAPAVRQIANKGIPVFLDLKFHDIPNTVHGAVKAACETGVFMMTVHTSGGAAMLEAAVSARNEAKKKAGVKPLLLGVTVLTSLEQTDLDMMGIKRKLSDQALALAEIAANAGIDCAE